MKPELYESYRKHKSLYKEDTTNENCQSYANSCRSILSKLRELLARGKSNKVPSRFNERAALQRLISKIEKLLR